MTRKRGRPSQGDLSVVGGVSRLPPVPAPAELPKAAKELWDAIVKGRPHNFYSAGDLPLLREYCLTAAVLIPQINTAFDNDDCIDMRLLDARDKLIRLATSLAGKLRIVVSSRTRADTANMRDSVVAGPKPWEDGYMREYGRD